MKFNLILYVKIEGVLIYDYLNWGLLIILIFFLVVNSLIIIFKENNLGLIIGLIFGGGILSIILILLFNGIVFIILFNNMSVYRIGIGIEVDLYVYYLNEFGIELIYLILIGNIYNEIVLLDILIIYYGE